MWHKQVPLNGSRNQTSLLKLKTAHKEELPQTSELVTSEYSYSRIVNHKTLFLLQWILYTILRAEKLSASNLKFNFPKTLWQIQSIAA